MVDGYKIIGNLSSWIFPTKKLRTKFRHICKEADSLKKYEIIKLNQEVLLEKLKEEIKHRKLKVVFLNAENQKWAYQSLYEELQKSPYFDVQVLVTLKTNVYQKKCNFLNLEKFLLKNYEFFKKRKFNVDFAFDPKNKKHIRLDKFKPDIIFYEQPWGLSPFQSPFTCSDFALTCYSSYGSCITNGDNEYSDPFFRGIWKYFIDNSHIKNILINEGSSPKSLVLSGQLKLDNYLKENTEPKTNIWPTNNKIKVIYAPHHSFYKESTLKFGTFTWNYKFFLDFAKQHQEIDFIFKPHPQLKQQIIRKNFMTFDEMVEYFRQWENLPNVKFFDEGNYFDIFKTSDYLITDCNSFLYEYLPTLKPVIHLISEYSVGHSTFGEKITSGYYKARSIEEIEKLIKEVIFNKKDVLLPERQKALNQIFRPENGTANFIKKYILEQLGVKES